MNGSTRAGVAAVLLVVIWIVVYWRTSRPAPAPPPGVEAAVIAQPAPSTLSPPALPGIDLPMSASAKPVTPQTPLVVSAPPPEQRPFPAPGETIPPTFDLYEVQRGDSAQSISQKKYGTTAHWRSVLKANPLLDFTRLKPGRIVRVPHDPGNTQGVVVDEPSPEFTEYTVAAGDTLSGISKSLYGTTSRWQDIRAANPSLNENGTNLRPGMKLKVPKPAAPQNP